MLPYRLLELEQAEVSAVILEVLDVFIYEAEAEHIACVLQSTA